MIDINYNDKIRWLKKNNNYIYKSNNNKNNINKNTNKL